MRDTPFPFDTVRDLVGLLRALYAATKRQGNHERRLQAIARVGRELQRAAEMARAHQPGSLGFKSAWQRAEQAVHALGDIVDCTTPLEPTLAAAGERVKRARASGQSRELRRRARRERS